MSIKSGPEKKDSITTVRGGICLVLDPARPRTELLDRLGRALDGGVKIVQVWNRWPEEFGRQEKEELIRKVLQIVYDRSRRTGRGRPGTVDVERENRNTEKGEKIPVLINEEWELLRTTALDGVHFDGIPADLSKIRNEIGREFLFGITCGNDLKTVVWAEENGADYISFCAMFPSVSAGECEIVKPETVRRAREITRLPLFVSGGITTENLPGLRDLGIDGVAVISGILNSDSPEEAAHTYQQILQTM
ncbi:MAG: thiamine phosphate synthase [Balneolaceae bacterium]